MTKLTKILLSIPSILGFVDALTYWNMNFFKWITNNVIGYEYLAPFVSGMILIQIGYLIYRLWGYKNLEKKIKTEWTWFLIIFYFISGLFFIWKKDTELNKMNKNTTPTN
ncbi:MAG: hypothetical protein N4A45_12195 [Flavobacteriales bacterium]|jgi:hypothetical protein|nr:hypothetical protein [Flavobacteriales bacterium]